MMIGKGSTYIIVHEITMMMATSGRERVEYRSYSWLNSLNNSESKQVSNGL